MIPVRSLEISFCSRPGLRDRLVHGDMVPGRAATVEAHGAAIDKRLDIDLRRAMDMAAEVQISVFLCETDTGTALVQGGRDLLRIIADGGDDSHSRDDDASHVQLPSAAIGARASPKRMLFKRFSSGDKVAVLSPCRRIPGTVMLRPRPA